MMTRSTANRSAFAILAACRFRQSPLRARLHTGRGVFHRGGMLHRRCPLARLAVRQQFDSASWLTCRRQALSLHDQRSSLPHGIRGWQSGIPGLRVPMQRRRRGQPAAPLPAVELRHYFWQMEFGLVLVTIGSLNLILSALHRRKQ